GSSMYVLSPHLVNRASSAQADIMNPVSTSPADTFAAPADPTPQPLGLQILPADAEDTARRAAAYENAGAVHLRGVLTAAEVTALREAFTSHIETDGSGGAFQEAPEGDP